MTSSEFASGLKRLSIAHETTVPYSVYQNGKQEILWAQDHPSAEAAFKFACRNPSIHHCNIIMRRNAIGSFEKFA